MGRIEMDIIRRPFRDGASMLEVVEFAYSEMVIEVLEPLTGIPVSDDERYTLGRAVRAAIARTTDALISGADPDAISRALFAYAATADDLRPAPSPLPDAPVATLPVVRCLAD